MSILKGAAKIVLASAPRAVLTRLATWSSSPTFIGALHTSLASHPKSFVLSTHYGFRYGGRTEDVIQRAVFLHGVWEPQISAWSVDHLRPGDVVVDIGANTGYYSLLWSRTVGSTGRVISYEPVPSIFAELQSNLHENSTTNVEAHPVALGEHVGTTEVYRASAANIGNSTTYAEPGARSEGIVQRTTGDESLLSIAPSIRLVKIDTEGDELAVLLGMPAVLDRMQSGAAVLVEVSAKKLRARGYEPSAVWRCFGQSWSAFQITNDYDFSRYATCTTSTLIPIDAVPSELADIVFIKS